MFQHFLLGRVARLACWAVLFSLLAAVSLRAQDTAAQVRAQIDRLRGIEATEEKEKLDELNQRMDAVWSFLNKHKDLAVPIVATELAAAQQAKARDQFLLLDLALYLTWVKHRDAVALGLASLEQIDPAAPVIRANWPQLFDLGLALGGRVEGPAVPRYLQAVDRLFFPSQENIERFRAPHLTRLRAAQVCAFLYGLAGDAGARHVAAQLATSKDPVRVLRILSYIGTEEQTQQIVSFMAKAKDEEAFSFCVHALLEVGGPTGRAAVLAVDTSDKAAESQAFIKKVIPNAERYGLEHYIKKLEEPGGERLSDARLQQLLDKMEAADGVDHETPPAAILTSGLPTEKLLAQMKRIRARSFRRGTQHVLEELDISDKVINALQYKLAAEAAKTR